MLTSTAPTARTRRRLAGAVGAGLLVASTVGVAALTQSPASAAIRGNIIVTPTSGNDETLFNGTVTTDCPADTAESGFFVEGPNIATQGAAIGGGPTNGDGFQQFSGASIANLKTNNAGSFATNSVYRIVFACISAPDGVITDTYEANLNYTAGGAGAFTITAATVAPSPAPSPTTPVSPSPTTPVSPSPTTPVSPSPTTPVSPSPTTPVSPSPTTSVSPSTSPGPGTGVGSGNTGTVGTGTGGTGNGTTGTGTGSGTVSGTGRTGSGTGSTGRSLPRTGAETGALVALSLALISGGGAVLVLGRRRNWFSSGTHQA